MNPQRVRRGVTAAEHPLVAPHRTNAAADLVGKVLQAELIKCLGESAAQCIVRNFPAGRHEQFVDRLGKPPVKEVAVSSSRNQIRRLLFQVRRKKEPADGIKKKQGTNPVVKISGLPPEGVDL